MVAEGLGDAFKKGRLVGHDEAFRS